MRTQVAVARTVSGGGGAAAHLHDVGDHREEVAPPLGGDRTLVGIEPTRAARSSLITAQQEPHAYALMKSTECKKISSGSERAAEKAAPAACARTSAMSSAAARVAAAVTQGRAPRLSRPVVARWAAARATARAAVLRVTWGTTMGASVGVLVAFGGLNSDLFVWARDLFLTSSSGPRPLRLGRCGS